MTEQGLGTRDEGLEKSNFFSSPSSLVSSPSSLCRLSMLHFYEERPRRSRPLREIVCRKENEVFPLSIVILISSTTVVCESTNKFASALFA